MCRHKNIKKGIIEMEYKDDMFKPEERPCCDGCDKECELFTGVNVPVEIEPDAKVGKIDVECCGEPEIKIERCHDCKQKIVITQKFFVKYRSASK